MVVLAPRLAEQLSGHVCTVSALSAPLAATSNKSCVDIHRDSGVISIDTDGGVILHLKVTKNGTIVAASDSSVFVVNCTQVEHRRHFRAIKSINVCERGATFVIFVVSEESVTKLDSHLDVIHANTAHLSASITSFSRPNYATSGILTTHDGTKLTLDAISTTAAQVDFYSGLGHYGRIQLEPRLAPSQLTFSTFGQPHGQSSCFVALGTQLFVIRGEDLRQSALCSFPHRIIRFAIFERHSALIVHCENSLVFRVKADFSSKTRVEFDNQAVLRDVAFDEEAEAMLMFFESNRVKLVNL